MATVAHRYHAALDETTRNPEMERHSELERRLQRATMTRRDGSHDHSWDVIHAIWQRKAKPQRSDQTCI